MLDRSDRGDSRRRGTDLVRVQQTRALSKHGRDPAGGKKAPAIYLTELGPRRVATQLKWLVSTIIVAVSGLAIIGVVIYTSMHVPGWRRHAGSHAARRPRGDEAPSCEHSGLEKSCLDRLENRQAGRFLKGIDDQASDLRAGCPAPRRPGLHHDEALRQARGDTRHRTSRR